MLKYKILFCLILSPLLWRGAGGEVFAQTNLVPNPSFEIHDTCPNNGGQVHYLQNWFTPTQGSPDYYDTCSSQLSAPDMGIPQNWTGYQYAEDGAGYVGLVAYQDSEVVFREYIEVKLTTTLTISTKYFVTFYISLADSSPEAIDQMGCHFSVDTIKRQDVLPFTFIPQIANPNFNYLSSKTNWTKISGSFIADSAYKFLTIGNFKDSAHTHDIYAPGGVDIPSDKMAYYYVDNVCVSTDSLACNATIGIEEFTNNDIAIFPNPANEGFTIKVNEPALLIVYNNIGIKIAEQKLLIGNNSINTVNYTCSMYFLEINNNQNVIREKIIINH